MTTEPTIPWQDTRLDAAFGALASAHPTPSDLVAATVAAIAAPRRWTLGWRGLAASAAALTVTVVVIGGVILGYQALRSTTNGASVHIVDGRSPDLRTLDAGEFRFDFPADWHADPTGPVGGGASTIALLGNETFDPSCRTGDGVDMDCISQQPLAPGAIRVAVSTQSLRGGTIFDRQDIENGTTTRPSIGEMPAVLDTFDYALDSFYREDASRRWSIAMPGNLGRAVTIELMAREWPAAGTGTTTTAIDALSKVLIDRFGFTPPPTPLPADPGAAVAAGRAALQSAAASFREAYVPAGDSMSIYFDCLAPQPEVLSDADVRFGPGGDLGGLVHLECYWSITEESPAIWRLDATYRSAVGEEGGIYIESRWLDARGTEIGSTFRGVPPPIVGPVATESEPPGSPGTTEPPGTPIPSDDPTLVLPIIDVREAIAIRDGGIDARELAVRGWYVDAGSIPCPFIGSDVHPLELRCPDTFMWLMQDPESLFVSDANGETMRQPTGPALNPDLDGLDRSWVPVRAAGTPPTPVEVVMVGHFDDPRAATCPTDQVEACRDRFVVDRVRPPDATRLAP